MRQVFQEIQFTRGLAMLDYVQAQRQIKRFEVQEYKRLLKSAALGFAASHEVSGIEQCLSLAKDWSKGKALTFQLQGDRQNDEHNSLIAEIEAILTKLKANEDE